MFLYNGKKITNSALTFNEIANFLDKINRKMIVLVMPIEDESQKNSENIINSNINPSHSPTIEELSSIVLSLQNEKNQSNNNEIQSLKQEIKYIKIELETYKAIIYNNKMI